MKTTPEFTDSEIRDVMDFKQVLALTEAAHRRSKKIINRIVTAVLITGLVVGSFFVYQRYSLSESGAQSQPPASTDALTPVLPDTTRQSASPGPAVDSVDSKKPTRKPTIAEKKKDETTSKIHVDSARSVFLPAEPVDGYTSLYDYFAKELHYPQEAIRDSVQGVVSVSFVINTEGKPEQVITDQSLGEAFDQEAIRLIENMPPWNPALLDGSPVRSKVSVPMTFSLKTARQK